MSKYGNNFQQSFENFLNSNYTTLYIWKSWKIPYIISYVAQITAQVWNCFGCIAYLCADI